MILSAKDVAIGYEGSVIIRGIDFTIENGDYVCVVGNNGSGKSTLIKTVLGLMKPVSGKIEYAPSVKKNTIGYLSQQTDERKIFPATVWEIVLSGCLNIGSWKPFFTKEQKAVAKEKMKLLGIESLKNKAFYELSGGQKQRVLLARALCATQDLIVLDEPVSGLDPKVTYEFYSALKEINQSGVTVLMVSHDVKTALTYANKILLIGNADCVFFENKDDYIRMYGEKGDPKNV